METTFLLDLGYNLAQNDIMLSQVIATKRFPIGLSVMLILTIALLVLPSSCLSAQAGVNRLVHMSVTDPLNRFVTGLDRDNFDIIESGARRSITSFSSVDDPIVVAVVGEAPLTDLDTLQGPSELIQTRSLSDAVRQLVASDKPRKALVITKDGATQTIPGGIFIVKTDMNMARKAVIEACNQYVVGFMSLDPSATVEVLLKQPHNLPTLKANVRK